MMNYTALKALIDSDPSNAAASDAEVLAWLKADITIQDVVTKAKLLQWCGTDDRLKNLKAAASNQAHAANNLAEVAVMLLTASDVSTFDTGDAANVAMLDALVAATVLTPADKTALMTLGEVTKARCMSAGVSASDLSLQVINNVRAA